jgi:imidazolonepropionase-like amidohydrolase
MHVHLEYFERPEILALFLANGVTTVRNMDGRPFILDWRRRIGAADLLGPRIYTAGPLLDGAPPVRPDNTVVRTADEARVAVEEQATLGYDFIKIYSALSIEAFGGIVEAAGTRRLPVAGHVPRAVGLDAALASHLSSIEHLADYASAIEADDSPFKGKGHWSKRYLSAPVDPSRLLDVARRQSAAGVASVPTLIQPKRELLRQAEISDMLARPEVGYLPGNARRQWEAMSKRISARLDDEDWALAAAGETHRRQVVAALKAAGVRLLIGTDTPNPFVVPGFSVHDELALAVEAGLSPAEALAASTREAARFLAATSWGTIERGKSADLLLLDDDPFASIANTQRIHGVMVRGVWLDRAARERMLGRLK